MPTGVYERTVDFREKQRKIALEIGYGKWMKGRIGEQSHKWKGGKPHCMDCGILLSTAKSKRCHKCWGKLHSGKNCTRYGIHQFGKESPNWIDGRSKDIEFKKKKSNELYATNPEFRLRRLSNNHKRRVGGYFDLKMIQNVYEDNIKKYGTLTCYLCLNPIEFKKDHLEHKTPVSRGGTNEYNNLGVSCKECNFRKHTKTEEEYRRVLIQ